MDQAKKALAEPTEKQTAATGDLEMVSKDLAKDVNEKTGVAAEQTGSVNHAQLLQVLLQVEPRSNLVATSNAVRSSSVLVLQAHSNRV